MNIQEIEVDFFINKNARVFLDSQTEIKDIVEIHTYRTKVEYGNNKNYT